MVGTCGIVSLLVMSPKGHILIDGAVDAPDTLGKMLGAERFQALRQTKGLEHDGLLLPAEVADLVRQGHELGEADDRVFGRTNSKQEEGAVGLLTGGVIDRVQLYEPSVVLALVAFRNADLY